ncbi:MULTISPECIES: hypothetical protein [Streptomyces]|uniref:Uncharacterized protein n=2 Tax=Streptomyces TaxID=1883 RepID=A0ABV9IV04_9ACTN
MFEYEIQARSAELLRRAERERLAREAVRGRRDARREAAEREPDSPDPDPGPRARRFRFARSV